VTPASDIIEAAIAWHLRLRDGSEQDWLAFTAWLEGDPGRSHAYDQVTAANELMPLALKSKSSVIPLVAVDDDELRARARPRPRWGLPLAATAAAIAIAVGTATLRSPQPELYAVSASPGQHRQVTIADGSTALLSGGTRLILDRNNPRYARLASGEAVFTIRHDSARPFSVAAGDHIVQDAGTSFNLLVDTNRFSIEVLSGAVLFEPERSSVRLRAGQILVADKEAAPVVRRKDPSAMASWTHGELSYSGATVESIASDLSRNLGVEVVAGADVAKVPFAGTIHLDPSAAQTVHAFSATLGVEARHQGQKWVIGRATRAPR
jgi:transmembrane sensor